MKWLWVVGQYWFLLVLLVVLSIGFPCSQSLGWLADIPRLSQIAVAITMFAMSWPIPFGEFRTALTRPLPAVWSIAINVGLFPLAAWTVSLAFDAEWGAGIVVLGAVPTTLASAAVWTRRAKGNDVICLICTMVTNGLCFLITPLWVFLLLGGEISPSALWSTVVSLIWVVLLPIAVGQLMRLNSTSAGWATQRKSLLGVIAQLGILWVVFLGSLQAGLRIRESAGDWHPQTLLWLALTLIGLHLTVWSWAFFSSGWFGFRWEDRVAVGFSASQKTLMVGLAVCLQMGISVVPLVFYHVLQLVVDTLLVGVLRSRGP